MTYDEYLSILNSDFLMMIPDSSTDGDVIIHPDRTILLISHDLSRTGAPIALKDMAVVLKEMGYRIFLLCKQEGELLFEYTNMDVTIILYPGYGNDLDWLNQIPSLFDTVVCNTLLTLPAVFALAPSVNKLLWWIHESSYMFFEDQKKYVPKGPGLLYLAAGPLVVRDVKSFYGADALFFPSYVDDIPSPPVKIENRPVRFLHIGTLDVNKGQQLILDAIYSLPSDLLSNCDFTFVVTQNKEPNKDLLHRMQQAETSCKNVHILPSMTKGELYRLYDQTDVVIVSSYHETNSVIATECLMKERLLIISDTSGNCAYLNNGNNALIFRCGDAFDLCDKISTAMLHYDKLQDIRRAGRTVFEDYYTRQIFKERLTQLL